MKAQQNTAIAQEAYRMFKAGDIEGVLGLCQPDVRWQLPQIDTIPFSGARSGKDEVARFFAIVGEQQEVIAFEPREFVENGDKVVALGHYEWQVRSTGRRFAGDWAHVFTIRDGQIAEFHEYLDSAAAKEAYRQA